MANKSNPEIRTFLKFSSIYRWQIRKLDDQTTEIRLIDLRYLNKGHYSFAAIAHLTQDQKLTIPILDGYLQKKNFKNCTLINLLTLTII